MKNKIKIAMAVTLLCMAGFSMQASAQSATNSPANPSKPDHPEHVGKTDRKVDMTTPSPVDATKGPENNSEVKKPKTPSAGENVKTEVVPSKPGASDQTK